MRRLNLPELVNFTEM